MMSNIDCVAFNARSYGVDLKETLQTSMKPGYYCDVISGRKVRGNCTAKTVKVKNGGDVYIHLGTKR